LINRVVDGIDGPITVVHVCRGNWSKDDSVLLQGGYEPLIPYLAKMRVNQFALEYATPRAGALEAISGLPQGAMLGLGTVNPRTAEIESPEWIAQRARIAAGILGKGNVFLNPDCGFGTFADRPVSMAGIAYEKLRALVAAAKLLRQPE
jgi:5-methyltetrahydropteroyltriglutamate--homocysteine methyltransferase